MRILDKVSKELKRQGKTQKNLTDYLGISKNVYTDWKSGKCKSITKHLPQIAEFLNVSVDYLLDKEKAASPAANSDEALMFALYGNNNADITQDMLDDVRRFAQFVRERKQMDESK